VAFATLPLPIPAVAFLKLTASSRLSAPPSGSPKCLRFGLWLTLCTLSIYLLTYLHRLSSCTDSNWGHCIWYFHSPPSLKRQAVASSKPNHVQCMVLRAQMTNMMHLSQNKWEKKLEFLTFAYVSFGFSIAFGFRCRYGECTRGDCWLQETWFCDGFAQCEDQSDEDATFCGKFSPNPTKLQ